MRVKLRPTLQHHLSYFDHFLRKEWALADRPRGVSRFLCCARSVVVRFDHNGNIVAFEHQGMTQAAKVEMPLFLTHWILGQARMGGFGVQRRLLNQDRGDGSREGWCWTAIGVVLVCRDGVDAGGIKHVSFSNVPLVLSGNTRRRIL